MRILVVAQTWEPEEGVPQRRWAWLTRALTAAGHEVHVLAPPPHYPTGRLLFDDPEYQVGAVAEGRNGEVIHRTGFAGHDPTLYSRMINEEKVMASQVRIGRSLARTWRPDIVLATSPPLPVAVGARAIAAAGRAPFILDLRDAWPDLLSYMNDWAPTTGRPARQGMYKRYAFRAAAMLGGQVFNRAVHKASGVVTTTEAFEALLRARGVNRTLTLRNFGAQRGVHLAPPENHDELRILYLGTTGRAQELSSALHALASARGKGIDARMRIVGSGAHLKTLKHNAEALDLPVEFFDRLPFDEVLPHYEWADTVLVHLQNWKPMEYTVPSKLYEAMEIGRHITLSANGEAARIIQASGAGTTVPAMDRDALASTWEALAGDRSLMDVSGKGAAWLDAQGSPEDNAERFVRFVEETARAAR